MVAVISDLIIQMLCYAGLVLITIFGMAMFLKGFFWKYFKVRTSFGKLVLIKVRTPLRDYYTIGTVEENFLCYKDKGYTIRIAMNSKDKIFYRSLGVNWVDVDEEKNAIARTDYSAVTGFDAKKHSDLLTRALMRPSITSNQEKIILIVVILSLLVSAAGVYFAYQASTATNNLIQSLPLLLQKTVEAVLNKGSTVTGIVNSTILS